MLNNKQIKLLQTALRQSGLRDHEGRYRMLLGQYRLRSGGKVTSSKQLNSWQLEDMLAMCESMGWRQPGKESSHYRNLVARRSSTGSDISIAQKQAIEMLAGDLGWNSESLKGFISKMTGGQCELLCELDTAGGHHLIEALKAILGRRDGVRYENLNDVTERYKEPKDGKESKIG